MKIYDELSREGDIKLRDPAPRPPKSPYRIPNLVNAPRRLLRPASMHSDVETIVSSAPVGTKDMTAGKVREFGRVRLCDLKLEDILENRHTPPLTLCDFEDYLVWVERSAENLYFELWLNNYKKHFAKVNRSSPASVNEMAELYTTGLETFFSQSSPLELNVRSESRRKVDSDVAQLESDIKSGKAVDPFLPPDAFDRAFGETHESLLGSFQAFLKHQTRNAHYKRGYFAMFLGSLTFLLGLVPTLVCTQLGAARAWRVLGLPFFFLGIVVLVGGLKRTCLVAFLFGDDRQLYPWEMARETDAASSFGSDSFSDVDSKRSPDLDHAAGTDSPRLSRSSSYPSLHYWPLRRSSSLGSSEKPSVSSPDPSSTTNNRGTLYFAPSYIAPKLARSSDVWAPLTPIVSPIIQRNIRDNVVAAAGYGLIATILTGAICLAVPNAS